MNIFSFLSAVHSPNDLWTIMINWVNGSVHSFGWAILLATIIVKLIMSPLDFWVKYNSKKQMLIQQKLSPQIAKLQKKFGSDQQTLKVQQQALYKREGLNMGVGCIVMLVQMVLTMVVFFTFYSSLRSVSAYQAINEYEQIEASYTESFYNTIINDSATDEITDVDSAKIWWTEFETAKAFIENQDNQSSEEYATHEELYESRLALATKATNAGFDAAIDKYNNIKSSWLWIENIWLADAGVDTFPNYDSLKSLAQNGGYLDYVKENINESNYNSIANKINASVSRQNGYYILAVSAGVLTFLSQWITELHNKLKSKKAKLVVNNNGGAGMNGGAMKIMKFVMPIIMILFVISTGASFGIYIFASNISSLVFGEISTLIVDALTKKKRLEVEEELEKEANRLIKKGKLQG